MLPCCNQRKSVNTDYLQYNGNLIEDKICSDSDENQVQFLLKNELKNPFAWFQH